VNTAAHIGALRQALARQRAALVRRDAAELLECAEVLVRELRALRAGSATIEPDERREIESAQVSLFANLQVLQLAGAANGRALAALMGPQAVYGRSGTGLPSLASRPIDAA
jgi:hypothetical protein